MTSSLNEIYTVKQIREIERIAIDQQHITEPVLMDRAGTAAFNVLYRRYPEIRKISVVCGKGNNGGDGFVVARLAHLANIDVEILSLCPTEQLPQVARKMALDCQLKGLDIKPFRQQIANDADVIVDAVLGIGITGNVRTHALSAIKTINSLKKPVLSIDIPSGLHADTGAILGECVKADTTVTFIGLKRGLCTGRASAYCGEIICADIDLSSITAELDPSGVIIKTAELQSWLIPREQDAHKGRFGHVLIVGGDYGMAGAVRMAAQAAARVGAGLVSVATRPEHIPVVLSACPEVMCHAIVAAKQLQPLLSKVNTVVLGPGLGNSNWSKDLFDTLILTEQTLVADASALNILAGQTIKRDHWVITPHPGEAACLLGCSSTAVQTDRYASAEALQRLTGATVVLKGAGTIIVDQDHFPYVCTAGNPGMASGGMGDVLSGIIAGLIAQNYSILQASQLGVCIHASAGDLAAKHGQRGTLATDLFPYIRQLVNPQ